MSLTEEGQDPVLDGIAESLRQDGEQGVVLSYVVVAVYADEGGSERPWLDTFEGQSRVTTMGLLDAGQVREQDRMRREWREGEEA